MPTGRATDSCKGRQSALVADGTRVAYLADGEQRDLRSCEMDRHGRPASQVTTVGEAPADIAWSPDGSGSGSAMFVPKSPTGKIDIPREPKGGKWTAAHGLCSSSFPPRTARFSEPGYRHMFVVTSEGGSPGRSLRATGAWRAVRWARRKCRLVREADGRRSSSKNERLGCRPDLSQ